MPLYSLETNLYVSSSKELKGRTVLYCVCAVCVSFILKGIESWNCLSSVVELTA